MRLVAIASALLVVETVFACNTTPTSAQLVRGWGDPERIVIEGPKHWTSNDIHNALMANIDVVVAGHPSAALDAYPQILAEKLKEGYLHGGFAQVTTTARLDHETKKVLLTVEEGPQYLAGEIQLQGASTIDAAQLINWLTSKQPDESARLAGFEEIAGRAEPKWVDKDGKKADLRDPAWKTGKPVSFAKDEEKPREASVRRAFAQQGFHHVEFKTSLVRDDANHTAALAITIDSEGKPTKIEKIEVTGAERDTQEDVVKYLGLEVGQTVTDATRSAWLHKLWLSGRYFDQEVTVVESKERTDPTVLKIRLVEYHKAPALRDPLSVEEQLLLKCRETSLAAIERGDALVIQGELGPLRVRFESIPGQGAVMFAEPVNTAKEGSEAEFAALLGPVLLAATPTEFVSVFAGGDKMLRLPMANEQFTLIIGMAPSLDPKDEKQKFALTLGFSFKSTEGLKDKSPFLISLSLPPVAMLGLLHQPEKENKSEIADGVLTLRGELLTCRIDVETGRLLECKLDLSEDEEAVPATVAIQKGNFAAALATAERMIGDSALSRPNAYDKQRAWSSCCEYFLDSPLFKAAIKWQAVEQSKERNPEAAYHAARKLLAANLLRPLDEAWATPSTKSAQKFVIPINPGDAGGVLPVAGMFGGFSKGIAAAVIAGADATVPRDSWPWTLSRGAALVLMQKAQYAGSDLDQLFKSKDMGPVGRLATATLVEYVSGELAARFAFSGVDKLTTNEFRHDYAPFLDSEKYSGQLLLRAAELLGELDDDEATELGRALLGKHHKLLVEAARFLREHKDLPIEQATRRTLDHVWANGLSDLVAEQLKQVYVRNAKFVREKEKKTL